jgi:hypothetical protein
MAADLRLVDALARLRLEAARAGYRVRLAHAPAELAELVELAGLSGTLGLELRRQPEEREEPLGVEEEGQLGDPAA